MTTTELTGAEEVVWDLADLYAGGDDPRIEQDVEQTETAAAAFRERYYGRVAELSAARSARGNRGARADRVDVHARDLLRASLVLDRHERLRRAARSSRGSRRRAPPSTRSSSSSGSRSRRSTTSRPTRCSRATSSRAGATGSRSMRKFRPYVLTEPEEKILTEKSVSGFAAWDRLYDELLGAIKVDLDGTEIGFEEAMSKLYSPDRDLRRRRVRGRHRGARAGSAHAHVRLQHDRRRQVDRRPAPGYATWISARNLSNDTTDEAVEALDRRGRRPLRRRPALLHAQGEAARARPALVLRPDGAARRRHDAGRVGRGEAARSRRLRRLLGRDGRHRRALLRRELDRRTRRATESGPARSARRTSPASTRTCS